MSIDTSPERLREIEKLRAEKQTGDMMNKDSEEFEIIDRYGARWRYKQAEGYFWSWTDVGEESVRVFLTLPDGEDYEEVATFPKVAMVGAVTPNTCLNLNLRELEQPEATAEKERDPELEFLEFVLGSGMEVSEEVVRAAEEYFKTEENRKKFKDNIEKNEKLLQRLNKVKT